MFLRKIANWISYNEELESSEEFCPANEYLSDNPEIFSRDLYNDNILSTPSLGSETSVLDWVYDLDDTSCDNEVLKFTNCGDQKRVQPVIERVREELKEENIEYEPAVESTENCQLLVSEQDKRRSINHIKNGIKDSTTNHTFTNKINQTISSYEEILRSNNQTSSTENLKNKRNTYTQTDKVEKRRSCAMISTLRKPCRPPPPVFDKKSKAHNLGRAVANVSPISPSSNENLELASESVVYGTLFVLGCNGAVPAHMVGAMGSKLVLRKRYKANGVKEAFSYTKPDGEPTNISPAKHVISYPLSHNQSMVVSFKLDKMTDMFQIGRYEKPPIDFKVSDINELGKARNGVSRFACRILVRRDGMNEARIYAAAFDSSQGIFLGESGLTWKQQGKMDGFTTNGVLIMHPQGKSPGIWREVSVCGFVYPLRTQNTEITRRPRIYDESNVLQDGSLIDLCGVTLVWRTSNALRKTPNREYLRRLQSTLHKEVSECQLPASSYLGLPRDHVKWATKKAYVYLSCGHVVGLVLSRAPENLKGWSCPICRVVGPIIELAFGSEPGFYMDREFPAYAFKPCGHAASRSTVEYWSSIKIPNHRYIQDSLCPFCGVKLNYIHQFIKLTLPTK